MSFVVKDEEREIWFLREKIQKLESENQTLRNQLEVEQKKKNDLRTRANLFERLR